MATYMIQYPHNAVLPCCGLTLVEGNVLRLKVEGVHKPNTLSAQVDNPKVLEVVNIKNNQRSDSWHFEFVAKKTGVAKFSIYSDNNDKVQLNPGSITVQVEAPIGLPDEGSEVGIMTRLLIAESVAPAQWVKEGDLKLEDVKRGMHFMRRVVVNRLNSDKPAEFMARGATQPSDIIKADDGGMVQFHGFNKYPMLPDGIAKNLRNNLAIANNGTHKDRALYLGFVQAAIEVASGSVAPDPSPTGLFGWRTRDQGAPSSEFKAFTTIGGNTFFTHTRLKKKD